MSLDNILIVSTAVVAGIVGAVSLYLFENIRNNQHSQRTDRDDSHLKSQLITLQNELEDLRKEYKKSLEKNKQKRKRRSNGPASVSYASEADFKSVAGTEYDSSSDEYYDFSNETGDEDDVTLTEDGIAQNGVIKNKIDQFSWSLERIDALLFDGSDDDMKSVYEILMTLYNTQENLSSLQFSEVLWRLCKYCQRMANVFKKDNNRERQKDIIYKGIEYGEKAVSINPDDYNTHKWYAILIGMRSEYQGTSDKIKDGKIFFEHTNIALQLNPKDGSLYHLRGRFVFEIASLSWFERKAASALFGELPQLTYDDAIRDFKMAEELHEVQWKENKLLLAECYIGKNMYKEAAIWLKDCNSITNRTSDDQVVSEKVEELLTKYSSYGN
ncbi:regulator of microtubule dynamics protein 1-like [Arctopsyche grandis]|uniref:regulator of microtubule dynamics protein 1-like n=1 Tax=Arctopsyche grandis TaxID=121162 RepID=UPI00406D8E72